MKYIFIVLFLIILGVGGFFGYKYLLEQAENSRTTEAVSEKTGLISETGVVQKLAKPGDDYTHMLRSQNGMIRLNSYTVKLDEYINKTITVEGQYSGNTLFVDVVK
jgi:hypothetical protein